MRWRLRSIGGFALAVRRFTRFALWRVAGFERRTAGRICAIGLGLLLAAGAPQAAPAGRDALCEAQAGSGVPSTLVARIARGFNLTGWIDRTPTGIPDPAVLHGLLARGLTHVRLPINGERLMPAFTSASDTSNQLAALDAALRLLFDLGFTVSLDMHPGGRFGSLHRDDPEAALLLLEQAWRLLARHTARYGSDRLLFEVLNEPPNERVWTRQLPRAVASLRAVAPDRILIVSPGGPQRIEAMASLAPLDDRRLVYAFHFYDPMAFTHQGNDWGAPSDPLRYLRGLPFPAMRETSAVQALSTRLTREGHTDAVAELSRQLEHPWTAGAIEAQFTPVGAWIARHRRPVVVNEFGAIRIGAEPDRARWIAAVRLAAERNCIGWAHWDYADAFGFVARTAGQERPIVPILDALVPRRPN